MTAGSASPKVGSVISVVVHGDGVQDLFGYELNVSYSADKWQFVDAASSLEGGFAVAPIVKDGVVTYAYTKVGAATAGVSGSTDLATLRFKAIAGGSSAIQLVRVKTVSKSLKANEVSPGTTVSIIVPQAAIITFTDVPEGYWAKGAIERAAALELVNGFPDGTFKPKKVVTRAEFVTMLARALTVPGGEEGAVSAFKDAALIGEWAKPSVAKALAAGWVKGFDDGTFKPNAPITRAEMTVIAVRALKLETSETATLAFGDANRVPTWAKASVAEAVKAGLIQGRENNTFAPADATTRAEAVVVLLRVFDYVGNR
ncbi:S-layer homology domain-containing protein [Cohnella sp. 56]|uniref:S-layer homology domain-containing protein n=1 Tax=Cohnella sp. 56 TaxID=3113722 RepID=UPI0030F42620